VRSFYQDSKVLSSIKEKNLTYYCYTKFLKMKKSSVFFAVLLAIACGSFAQNKPVDLKFKLAKGESYDYTTNMNITTKGEAGGQPIDVKNTVGVGYHFTVTGDSSGWKKLSALISRVAMNISTGGVNINYDSDKPTDSSDMISSTIGNVLGALKNGQFNFTMNEKGDIGSISGINEMMEKMMASSSNLGPMASGISNAFDEDNFKQNLKQAFGIYPGKPVKPGDSWNTTNTTNKGGMEITSDNVYTLESVSGDLANIKVNSKISSTDTTTHIAGTITGTMQYNIPSGIAIDGDLNTDMNMEVNAGGQSIPMTIGIKTKITGKKS